MRKNGRSGQIVIIALLFLGIGVLLASTLYGRTANFLRFGGNTLRQEQAINIAEAGVDYAVWQLNETLGTFTGPVTVALTDGAFTAQVQEKSPPNPLLKTVVVTAFIPDAVDPREKQTIKVDVFVNSSSSSISFHYAVQTDEGGVVMANSARINGTIYSNGSISGSGSSSIGGDAYAVSFITSPDPTVDPGFNKYPFSSPQPFPTLDYEIWRTAAASGGVIDCSLTPSECNISGGTKTIGPKKYIGDLVISNQAVVTVNGPIWVTKDAFGGGGNVTVRNGNTQVNLAEIFGSSGTVWVVDSKVSVEQGAAFNPTTSDPKGYILVATTDTSANAMSIGQSGANAVFYALEGGAELSQTAHVNSLTANLLTMTQQSTLDYDTGLASTQFTTGPGGSWEIKRGTYLFK